MAVRHLQVVGRTCTLLTILIKFDQQITTITEKMTNFVNKIDY